MSNSDEDVRSGRGPQIVSRRADRREETTAAAATAAPVGDGAATTAEVYPHTYEVASVPPSCTDYTIGDYIDLWVSEPPPTTMIVHMPGACDGLVANLVQ